MTGDPVTARPLIVLATPCFGGLVHQGYMLSVCKLVKAAEEAGFDLELMLLGGDSLISRARAHLVAQFLDRPRATHLLFVDADITFEPEALLRLLRADKDFCAAFYPLKMIDWAAIPRRVVAGETLEQGGLSYVGTLLGSPERVTEGDFSTALYAGTGFQLIKRVVFDRLIAAHPELRFRAVHTASNAMPTGDNLCALFDCLIDPETGVYLSEDYAFCRRWRALGGDIWLDLKSELTHVGPQAFRGAPTTRQSVER